ncbi:unnamed protein product [Penicillium camemberti]|uniref:Str. FM013 n=1 Tax=Penicillium camemberti (strain FM 013) TaxID=1429867 RepID=A0A0G4PYA9_PENC3|nr:unnamed protein product [Penicillium camemberti]
MDVSSFYAANFAIGYGRVAKATDEETAKSCSPCARALWSNVLGSIEIASTSGSVELQNRSG